MPAQPEIASFLQHQRQVRVFTDEPVSDDDLNTILEIARWTGSAKNTQPWTLIVVTDPESKQLIADATQWTTWAADAPLIVTLVMNGDDLNAHGFDEGRLAERVLLGAQALGLGAGIITFDRAANDNLKARFGVPADRHIHGAVVIGHASGERKPLAPGGRKPLSELVFRERMR